MTETPSSSTDAPNPSGTRKRSGGLAGMLIADLKSMAGGLGVAGAGSMKKAQLIDAIKAAQSGGGNQSGASHPGASESGRVRTRSARTPKQERSSAGDDQDTQGKPDTSSPRTAPQDGADGGADAEPRRGRGRGTPPPEAQPAAQAEPQAEARREPPSGQNREQAASSSGQDKNRRGQDKNQGPRQDGRQDSKQDGRQDSKQDGRQDSKQEPRQDPKQEPRQDPKQEPRQDPKQGSQSVDDGDPDGDGEGGSRRNRRRRGRDRTRTTTGGVPQGNGRNEPDTTVLDDDVLVPAAGILDVLDNYAFVRTSGYLPGVDDVYLSLSMVRKFGLRRGDAIVGQVRQPREGERKEKFNPMVRIDSVNGADPDAARNRPDFAEMTPVHPDQRLRLETGPTDLIGRMLDLAAPIGKGQRAVVVSPAHGGKTTLLRSIAESVTRNNPECHLMVVLVDERPEEVTDFQRSVKGEVVASTFDRPPADHTIVAELSIERAKRLVELGHDVVVLLDGLTRLSRAYNLAAPAGGRALAMGMDASALYPPKRFFGAARKLEDGGSLTIIATAVHSGSPLDELILDELGDTANAEVRLRRDLVDAGLFPAVDVLRSGTRAVDRLIGETERDIHDKLRRALAGMDDLAAAELLLDRLRSTQTNVELLTRVQQAPGDSI